MRLRVGKSLSLFVAFLGDRVDRIKHDIRISSKSHHVVFLAHGDLHEFLSDLDPEFLDLSEFDLVGFFINCSCHNRLPCRNGMFGIGVSILSSPQHREKVASIGVLPFPLFLGGKTAPLPLGKSVGRVYPFKYSLVKDHLPAEPGPLLPSRFPALLRGGPIRVVSRCYSCLSP